MASLDNAITRAFKARQEQKKLADQGKSSEQLAADDEQKKTLMAKAKQMFGYGDKAE